VALGIFLAFILPSSRIEHISVSSHYSKINRRSVGHGCPRFAYSFVSLTLRQYYLYCAVIRSPLIGKAQQRINKNLQKKLIAAVKAPRFAYRRGERAPLCL
jgi:hypothetical protein